MTNATPIAFATRYLMWPLIALLGAGALGVQRKRDWIGLDGTAHGRGGLAVAGLTDRGTVIDIDAEVNHRTGN